MKKTIIAACVSLAIGLGCFFLLTASHPPSGKPTITKTAGGFGSNFAVYEYRSSEGYVYVIVQSNGQYGPVSVFR